MTNAIIAIIILICILVSFILNKIPIGLTALLGALAMAAFGIIPFSSVLSNFGSDTVMMVAGVTVIGNTLFETGGAQLLGKTLINVKGVGTNEKVFLIVIIVLVAIISAFVSNTATVAMMIPVISSVAAASKGKITKKNTYMAMSIASVVGGNATLAGSTPQLVAQGVLEQTAGCRSLAFFELAKGTLPIVLAMIVYFATIGYRLEKRILDFPDPPNSASTKKSEEISYQKVVISALVFVGCMVAFVAGIATFGTIAVLGACICVLTGCISPKRVWETMDWRTIVVLGGSLGFASGLEQSGALQLIADQFLLRMGGENVSVWFVSAVIILICSILSNMMSNTATTAIMTPFVIALAQGVGHDVIPYVVMVIIGSNLAFATPMCTPPLTMVLVGGYRFTDYLKIGGLFTIIAVIIAVLTIPVLYGLV